MLENLRRALDAVPKLVVAPYPELVRAIGESLRKRSAGGRSCGGGRRPTGDTAGRGAATEPQPERSLRLSTRRRSPSRVRLPSCLAAANHPAPGQAGGRPEPVPAPLTPPEPVQPPVAAVEEAPQAEAQVAEAIETTLPPQHTAPEPNQAAQPGPAQRPSREAPAVQPPPARSSPSSAPGLAPLRVEVRRGSGSPASPLEEPAPEPPARRRAATHCRRPPAPATERRSRSGRSRPRPRRRPGPRRSSRRSRRPTATSSGRSSPSATCGRT